MLLSYSCLVGALHCRRYRFGAAVADAFDLREQFRHLHSRQRFEQRRNLGGHADHVSGHFVHARCGAIAGGNDGDLVDVGQRRSQRANDFRQAGDQFVDDGGLVVFLIRFGFDVHGPRFGFAFLEDDLGFGFALSAYRGGMAFGFQHQALLFGFGQRFDAAFLDFRLFQNRGDQFAFVAEDFGFLNFDFLFLFDLPDLHGFGDDLLLHDVGLESRMPCRPAACCFLVISL